MTTTRIRVADIEEFGIYEEGGAIILGLRLIPSAPFGSVIFQIDTVGSDQRRDRWGMYTEFDGKALYGAVSRFDFDPQLDILAVDLDQSNKQGHDSLSIELPRNTEVDTRILLAKMAEAFRNY